MNLLMGAFKIYEMVPCILFTIFNQLQSSNPFLKVTHALTLYKKDSILYLSILLSL